MFGAALLAVPGMAEDSADTPDAEFLEYLGMWEETDEDWQLFTVTEEVAEKEERTDPEPQGEESTEKEDES